MGLILLLASARLWRLDAACLWFDELFGLHAARHGWGELARFVALDLIHPPLFYALLKVWVAAGGESVWWLRLFAVAASALALAPVALLGRELRLGRRAILLALALAASSGYLIKYAREVRMYSPLLLFAACSLWLFARLCNAETGAARRRAALATATANLLLVYTHYFGWLVVGLELVFLLAWRRGLAPRFAAWAAGLALAFAPWAWGLWRAAAPGDGGGVAQNIGWAARPALRELLLPYLLLHEPFRFQQHTHEPAVLRLSVALAFLVFAPPLAALAWRAVGRGRRGPAGGETTTGGEGERRDDDAAGRVEATAGDAVVGDAAAGEAAGAATGEAAGDATGGATAAAGGDAATHDRTEPRGEFALRFLVFFSVAPVVLTFLLAHALPHSVWGTRHLIVIAPAYLLLAAHAVVSLRPGWLAACVCGLLGCWLALAAALYVTRRPAPPVWCAWGTLARAAVRDDEGSGPRDGEAVGQRDDEAARPRDGEGGVPRDDGAMRRDEGAMRRDETTPPRDETAPSSRGPLKVYAVEDLVAYHLWHESVGGGRAFAVSVVRGVPGAVEDKAFFLPRGFDGVSVAHNHTAFGEERFWLAFRAAAWDESHPALKSLAARGYAFERRHEMKSQGQTAILVLVVRRRR